MSQKFLYVAGIVLTIIVGTILFWYFYCDCGGKSRKLEPAAADTSIVPDEQIAEPVAPAPDTAAAAETPAAVDWQAIKDRINDQAPTLQFEPYQTEATLSHEGADVFGEIIDYLDNNAEGSLLVTGHTDISGPRSLNMQLSQGRAEFLKNLLVQHGVEAGKITTEFKGPDDPIADNSTAEGRARNRRADVIIK